MKRLFSAFVALAFSLSLAGVAMADTKAGSAKSAGKAHTASHVKAAGRKPKIRQITGTVEAVDMAAGTLTVKGRKKSVSLKTAEKMVLGEIHEGDRVFVKYKGGTATKIRKVAAKE